MQRKDWAARVDGLVVFRGLLSAAPFAALRTALAADAADLTGAVAAFESTLFLQGTNWTEVLLDAVLEDENLCLRTAAGGDAGPVLEKALENELEFLLFVLYELAQLGVGHDVKVFVFMAGFGHILAGNLLIALPLVVANVEGGHLVVGITTGIEDGLVEVEEGGLAVYLDFAEEAIDFFGNKLDTV